MMNPEDVPLDLRLDCEQYARQAAAKLGLSQIQFEWHQSAPGGHRWFAWVDFYADMKYQENTIHVNVPECAAADTKDVLWTIYHEARHLWQIWTSRFIGSESEKDATEWACRELGFMSEKSKLYWDHR